MSFQECSKELEGDSWNTYTTFFTHSENICFYYRSLLWYEKSEETINKLAKSSSDLSESV